MANGLPGLHPTNIPNTFKMRFWNHFKNVDGRNMKSEVVNKESRTRAIQHVESVKGNMMSRMILNRNILNRELLNSKNYIGEL